MKTLIKLAVTVLLIGSLCGHANAQNIERGAELAAEWCANCHDVSADGPFKQYPPSFASVAIYRTRDFIFSRIMFSPVHTGMPKWGNLFSREDVTDLVAYIASLEKPLTTD